MCLFFAEVPSRHTYMFMTLTETAIVGQVEERGRRRGKMKLSRDGLSPNSFVIFGEEKSSISLLRMMPVSVRR